MNKHATTGAAMLATIMLSALTATATVAAPMTGAPAGVEEGIVEFAQANCNAAAQQVVAQTGGQLLSVSPGPNGTCSVTVLVPGQGNERPRKVTVNVQG
jgi:hypothetical protein